MLCVPSHRSPRRSSSSPSRSYNRSCNSFRSFRRKRNSCASTRPPSSLSLEDAIAGLRRPQQPRLSIKDVYDGMDEEQRSSSRIERHKRIEYAQKRAASTCKEESRSLVSVSRCTTAQSRKSADVEDQEDDASDDGATVVQLPGGKMCDRVRSALQRDADAVSNVSSLSRQCCDVLGPSACHQCDVINRRRNDTERQDTRRAAFPNLHASEENYSTALRVAKACPKLNAFQIQTKIVCGEIFNPGFGKLLERRREQLREKAQQEPSTKKFIFRVSNVLSAKKAIASAARRDSSAPAVSFSELVNPVFVSRRQLDREKREPIYKAYYEPPLVPKSLQYPDQSFYPTNSCNDEEDELFDDGFDFEK